MGASCTKPKVIASTATPEEIDEFLSRVRPLDLIVFRGGEGVSTMITKLEKQETGNGTISHVEVAITREWCSKIKGLAAELPADTLMSWGSTMSGKLNDGVDNAETGKMKFGVQVRILRDLVKAYLSNPDANVGVCRLIDNPIERRFGEPLEDYLDRARKLKYKIAGAYEEYNGVMYNPKPLSLLGALFPMLRPLRHAADDVINKFVATNKWLFCSEFAAALYCYIGVITDATDGKIDGKTLKPEDVLPVDFVGADQDADGIVNPICEMPPKWVKEKV